MPEPEATTGATRSRSVAVGHATRTALPKGATQGRFTRPLESAP
ncbi:hypothetical protein BJP36_36400 [Moorena producens JHB]|uniref:Uncharacterized protein n=1 Tax=Moorena producens (strain JHB) TaxID=1454205 RepID=A0A9Q9STX8_MOOP1|nr:hypothetical protein [Moorena producens]WAN69572.1 hypothetical protein BJP36_36400 [Moorena producens JHB]